MVEGYRPSPRPDELSGDVDERYIERAEKRIKFNLIKNQRFIRCFYTNILKTLKIPYCIKKRDFQCSLYN